MDHARARAFALGLLTLVPVAYLPVFLYVMLPQLELSFARNSARYAQLFNTVLWIHLAVVLLSLGLLGFYIVQARRSVHLPRLHRTVWVALLFVGNMFVMPVFWYLYIWRPVQRPGLRGAA